MKKNWFQILSLALNVALLIALLVTRAELVNTRTILKSNLDGIAYRLSDVDDRITNLSAKQRRACRIFPWSPPALTRKVIRCKPT